MTDTHSTRILYIEDEPDLRELFQEAMEEFGHLVETTANGNSGLELHKKQPFDIVVTDYQLPDLNGVEVARQLLSDDPELPVIILTGRGSEQIASEATALGVTQYLIKNSTPGFYIDLVPSLIGKLARQLDEVRKREYAEKALKQSEEKYRNLYQDTPVMMHSLDMEGRFISVSNMWLEIMGYELEDVIGQASLDFLTDESRQYAANVVMPEFSRTGAVRDVAYKLVRKDGSLIDVLVSAIAERNDTGEIIRSLAVVSDVTERVRVEQEAQLLFNAVTAVAEAADLNSALEAILRALCEGVGWTCGEVWLPNAERKILEPGPTWIGGDENLHGFITENQEMVFAVGEGLPGRVWESRQAEWLPGISSVTSRIFVRKEIAEELGINAGFGVPVTIADKVVAVICFYMTRTREDDLRLNEVVSATTRQLENLFHRKEVVERLRESEENLRLALADAERANKAKSEFLATMSHEFRTPLNAILGFSEMMREQLFGPLGSENYREYASDIHLSGEHMLAMVNDVLDIAAIEAGKRELAIESIAIADVVEDCVRNVEPALKNAHIALVTDIPDDLPALHADRRSILQIVLNLLSNAIKFSKQNGTITLSVTARDDSIVVKIEDTGIGISPERLPGITRPFSRTHASPEITQDGTGLGLSIVKSLVELHDGELNVESELDKGTVVTAVFPLKASAITLG